MNPLRFFCTVPKGFADLLAAEITALGGSAVRETSGGVGFEGTLAVGYRALLESRVASRILLEIARAPVTSADDLYALAHGVDWREHLDSRGTLACEFTGQLAAITNTHYGALRLKDAICDQLRDTTRQRPSVETTRPDLRVHAHAQRGETSLLIDLAGEALSRRGYRLAGGEAPLRENIAAGILLRAGWPAIAQAGGEFLDPMCGSGTFVIEAAWMATDTAPGLLRDFWGFNGWRGHDAALWNGTVEAARARMRQQLPVTVRGADRNRGAIATAQANARRAGVGRDVTFEHCDIATLLPHDAAAAAPGLLCVNPPYGLRIPGDDDAAEAHRAIGEALRGPFAAWHAAVLTGEPRLGQLIGCEASRVHTVWNGAIECRVLRFLPGARKVRREARGIVIDDATITQSAGAQMFANRLRKNLQHMGKIARREGVGCWRLYDADMPEYALAIDLYTGAGPDEGRRWLYVQEYAPPDTVDPEAARRRREEALAVLPEVTGIALTDIRLRTRRRQKGGGQYVQPQRRDDFHVVEEAGLKLRINLDDYLDTGLFLDHRLTRQRIGKLAKGQRFLNLFCYTGVATLHAAAGGAASTLSVDLSRNYLDWAAANLALNGFAAPAHRLEQADVLQWLGAQPAAQFDLIFLDPPTFSNSARMEDVLDTQRDHARLIEHCMRLLSQQGLLLFSTNAQRFALDTNIHSAFRVADISAPTIPFDFQGNPRIHRCFELRHR
ncbi:MAG TPA: bifunctional 23S rRNA (guanine(2069)-N(7))-methyltransferase RlmK/23S rRNA (guanine(2445)-N(2))-methyltransferase RlmL [Steroidobacteraceae bacterium]|nr:bifunctional 23S rRNA (guanine(2069)-N(7))-methyltransferase RlmK/23S rRNA (guanine(2445)-N(2))-methyltransferase RlmL [Steroidobacteraceae bacterium]